MAKSPVEDIPISISTAQSAQEVRELTQRINGLYEAVNRLSGAFGKLPEGVNFRNTLGQLNQMLSAIRTVNADVAKLNAAAAGARNLARAVDEAGVQRAQRAGALGARNALRSQDPTVIGNALEASERRANQLLLKIEQLGQAIKNTDRTPQQIQSDEKALKNAQDRLTKEQQTNAAIRERLALLQREDALTRGVESRLRSREVGQRFRQTPEALADVQARESAAADLRSRLARQRRIERERREQDRANELAQELSLQSAQLQRREERRERGRILQGLNRSDFVQLADRRSNIMLTQEAFRGLYALPSSRELLTQNRASGIYTGWEAARQAQMSPGAMDLLVGLAQRGQQAQAQAGLNNLRDPGFRQTTLQAQFERAQLGLQTRQRLQNDRQFQETNNQMARQQMVERLTGDGGASLMAVQAASLRNFAVLTAVVGSFTAVTKAVVDFDNALKQLQAVSGSTNEEMRSLQATIVSVSRGTRFTAVELTQAATTMAQAGLSIREVGGALRDVSLIATATGSTLQTAVDIMTSALSVYRLRVDETGNVANQMVAALNLSKLTMEQLSVAFQYVSNTAADAGLSFSETTAALATLANQGIRSGSTMGTNLRQMMVDLMTPNENLRRRMHELGLSMSDVDIRANGLAGAIQNMTRAGFTAGDAFETMELRGANAFTALSRGARGMLELEQAILNFRGANEANNVQMESLAARFILLYNNAVALATAMSGPVVEAIRATLGSLNSLLGSINLNSEALGIMGTVIAGIAFAGMASWLVRVTGLVAGMTAAVAAARTVLLSFTTAAAVAGTTTATLVAATSALGAAWTALPLLAVVGGFTALVMWLGSSSTATADMARGVDSLRTSFNNVKGQVDSTGQALTSLEGFLNTQIARSEQLRTNTDALATAVAQARDRFGNLSQAVWNNITSYDALIGRLREVRSELRATLSLQVQNALAANQSLTAGLQGQIEAPFSPGAAQSELFRTIFGRDVQTRPAPGQRVPSFEDQLRAQVGTRFGQDNEAALRATRFLFGLDRPGNSEEAAQMLGRIRQELGSDKFATDPRYAPLRTALDQRANREMELAQGRITGRGLSRQSEFLSVLDRPEVRAITDAMEAFRNQPRPSLDTFRTQAEREAASNDRLQQFSEVNNRVQEMLRGLSPDIQEMFRGSDAMQQWTVLQSQLRSAGREVVAATREHLIEVSRVTSERVSAELSEINQQLGATRDPEERNRLRIRGLELIRERERVQRQAVEAEIARGQDPANLTTDTINLRRGEIEGRISTTARTAEAALRQSVTQADQRFADAAHQSAMARLRQLQARGGAGGQRQGSESDIRQAREQVLSTYRAAALLRGESPDTINEGLASLRSGFTQNDGSAGAGGAGFRDPNRGEFRTPRSEMDRPETFALRLRQINAQANVGDERLRAATATDRAFIDAARRLPDQFPEAVLRQRQRNLNQTEIQMNIDMANVRQEQVTALEELKTNIDAAVRRLEPEVNALAERVRNDRFSSEQERQEVLRQEQQYTQRLDGLRSQQTNIMSSLEQARARRDLSVGLREARSAQQEGGMWEGFTDAASMFGQRSGINDSSRVMWGETFTEMMQGATSAFREFVQTVTTGGGNVSQAFNRMMSSMLQSAAQAAGNRALNMILGLVFKSVAGAFGGVSFGGTGAPTADMSIGTDFGSAVPNFNWYHGGVVPKGYAAGGIVEGANIGRDNVLAALAGGEGVLNHRAMSVLGNDFVHAANAGAISTASTLQPLQRQREPDQVNVYVVTPDQKPQLTAKDVIYIVGEDIATGGTTKRLVRQVSMGG